MEIELDLKGIVITIILGIIVGCLSYLSIILFHVTNIEYNILGIIMLFSTIYAYYTYDIKTFWILDILFLFFAYTVGTLISDYGLVNIQLEFKDYLLGSLLFGFTMALIISVISLLFKLVKVHNIFFVVPFILILIELIVYINGNLTPYYWFLIAINLICLLVYGIVFKNNIRKIFK